MDTTDRVLSRDRDAGQVFVGNTADQLLGTQNLKMEVPDQGPVPDDPEDDLPGQDYNVGVLGAAPMSFDVSAVPTKGRV
jgi:hypothetical protein